jgi:hypothetical protein
MKPPANDKAHLWARIVRIQLARWAMRASQIFDDLAEWILPTDLRRQP